MQVKSEPKVALPPIPAKRYFTIGEVSELCGVKPHVLRYWEQEFTQLRPMKRRGNRRYYQHHEVLLIRRIRELLYEEGFTINGARNRLSEMGGGRVRGAASSLESVGRGERTIEPIETAQAPKGTAVPAFELMPHQLEQSPQGALALGLDPAEDLRTVRAALEEARDLLS
jgi:DNA-binding transcriptional MerR regulator